MRVVAAVDRTVDCPLRTDVLRNNAETTVSIPAAVEADFVRVDIHTGAAVTDQDVFQDCAHKTLRFREQLGVDSKVLADVGVKHTGPLGVERSVGNRLANLVERGLAGRMIVSGAATGEAVDTDTLETAVAALRRPRTADPIFASSGVTTDSAAQLLGVADGAVVDTALKEGGQTTNPVTVDRVERLANVVVEDTD